MAEVTFKDNSCLYFGRGYKDDWCVFYRSQNGKTVAPLDKEYFQILINAAELFSTETVWDDFCSIYDKTVDEWKINHRKCDDEVFTYINYIAHRYIGKELVMEKTFSILYMAMLAEYRYERTKLDKLIKKLAVYRILFCGISAIEAANENKKKSWHKIYNECVRYGLVEENF